MDDVRKYDALPADQKHKLSTRDCRIQRVAIMESLGMSPREINKATRGSEKLAPSTTYYDRKLAHHKGYVKKIQEGMRNTAINLVEERRILAERCFGIVNKKAQSILESSEELDLATGTQKGIKLKEAEFALKAIGETEHSGRKTEPPKVVVNVMKEASLNIQQNFQEIGSILDRVGLGFGEVIGAET